VVQVEAESGSGRGCKWFRSKLKVAQVCDSVAQESCGCTAFGRMHSGCIADVQGSRGRTADVQDFGGCAADAQDSGGGFRFRRMHSILADA